MSRARGDDPDLPDHTGYSLNDIWNVCEQVSPEPEVGWWHQCLEFRAYEGLPFYLSTGMLSDTSGIANSSLIKSLNFDDGL